MMNYRTFAARLAKPLWHWYAGGFLLLAAVNMVNLQIPQLAKHIINDLTNHADLTGAPGLALSIVGVLVQPPRLLRPSAVQAAIPPAQQPDVFLITIDTLAALSRRRTSRTKSTAARANEGQPRATRPRAARAHERRRGRTIEGQTTPRPGLTKPKPPLRGRAGGCGVPAGCR
mgnify:CR=1 FL=1